MYRGHADFASYRMCHPVLSFSFKVLYLSHRLPFLQFILFTSGFLHLCCWQPCQTWNRRYSITDLGGNTLDLCILNQRIPTQIPAQARLLETTKRSLWLDDAMAVDPARSCSKV